MVSPWPSEGGAPYCAVAAIYRIIASGRCTLRQPHNTNCWAYVASKPQAAPFAYTYCGPLLELSESARVRLQDEEGKCGLP